MQSKKARQYAGMMVAVVAYYIVHEGAHLLVALNLGVFKAINFIGLMGVQIDVDNTQMGDTQMGEFCLMGAVSTFLASYILVALAKAICRFQSPMFRAIMYYVTLAMMLLDPLYLSLLCGFVGGGDMNGIALLFPETMARIAFGILLTINILVFWKYILPLYTKSFKEQP